MTWKLAIPEECRVNLWGFHGDSTVPRPSRVAARNTCSTIDISNTSLIIQCQDSIETVQDFLTSSAHCSVIIIDECHHQVTTEILAVIKLD
ncbi:hypothetical protein ACKS0A_02549 [Histoplasma ohiense]